MTITVQFIMIVDRRIIFAIDTMTIVIAVEIVTIVGMIGTRLADLGWIDGTKI